MSATQSLVHEAVKVVTAILPINTTGAGQTGRYVNLKNAKKLAIVIQTGAWAGGTAAVTLRQAKDNADGSGKALGFSTMYTNIADTTKDALVKTTVAANTFDVGTANGTWVIEVDPHDLDVANGFTHLRVATASPGANADLISAIYLLTPLTYDQGATEPRA